jgi:large subunit ribosomal protein L6
MSRLGKKPVVLPSGVTVTASPRELSVTGPKGTLTRVIRPEVAVTVADGMVTLTPKGSSELGAKLWGTYAAHVRNMIAGVTEGYIRILELEGVGYRAEVKGKQLVLTVGFSHPVVLSIPEGVGAVVEKGVITLTGTDKDVLGQFAANVRRVKKPEPYKGKGIRYRGEFIIRKQGKKAQ